MPAEIKITGLPTRYEPLVRAFGDKAKTTFVPSNQDLDAAKRFLTAAESAHQGKLIFIEADSGSGKSTFVHSLEVFLPDKVSSVIRLPPPHELAVVDIPGYLAQLAPSQKFSVVNFDGREAPYFQEAEYQTFLGAMNGVLRSRSDLVVIWPVTDPTFSARLVTLLERVGGRSAFGPTPIHRLHGLPSSQYGQVLEKILQMANWRLEDAAIATTEVDNLIQGAARVGAFLDDLQALISNRFDVGSVGVTFPSLVIAISSSEPKIRETCRSLRRADSFYIEASRLLMYTKKSNVAEWWANRATDLKSALPHVIALLNAQLVSLSASAVVHSVLHFGEPDLLSLVQGVRADRGNARKVVRASELYRFTMDDAVDNREYGSNVKDQTFESYDRLQNVSETRHRALNAAILGMLGDSGAVLSNLAYEATLVTGLQSDACYNDQNGTVALEFHHKARNEANSNKLAIYVLEKLKEYAINFGLARR